MLPVQKETDEALGRCQLIIDYLPLAYKAARTFAEWFPSVDVGDLRQAASEGLVRSADAFDPSRGSFATYAAFWIRKHLYAEVSNSLRLIKPPDAVLRRLISTRRIRRTFVSSFGHEPTFTEFASYLADHLEITYEDAVRVLEEVSAAEESIASLDQPVGHEGGGTLGDFVEAPDVNVFGEVEPALVRSLLRDVVSTLNEREQRILKLRFGLGGDDPMPLKAIAEATGISSQRVSRIVQSSLAKLRDSLKRMTEDRSLFASVIVRADSSGSLDGGI